MTVCRLPHGGRIDRSKPLRFSFDGRAYEGFAGDTLASALIANGVHLVGRSFKYHRPRGIVSAGAEEPNALVTVVRERARCTPNLRATQIELYDGLVAESQNRWPSLAFDVSAANSLVAPLIPAGFYYKTFMWPKAAWKRLYEPRIRAMAGLGRAPTLPDPDRYAHRYAHCDVLVVGAGPAGLAAALAAAECGARVLLCDEQAELGGSLLAERRHDRWQGGAILARRNHCALSRRDNVTLLPRTTAFGYFPHNMLGACRARDRTSGRSSVEPAARTSVAGARQGGRDRGRRDRAAAGLSRRTTGRGSCWPTRRASTRRVTASGRARAPSSPRRMTSGAYRAALDLAAAGVEIAAIVDLRAHPGGPLRAAALAAGLP